MAKGLWIAVLGFFTIQPAMAETANEYLLKLKPEAVTEFRATLPKGSRLEALNFNHWYKVILPVQSGEIMSLDTLSNRPGVSKAQPNFKISLPPLPGLPALRKALVEKGIVRCEDAGLCEEINVLGDNPPIPPIREPRSGNDPLLNYQWGVLDIGATAAWRKNVGNPGVVVAVIDTGVDYTHEDLRENLWRNPGEHGTDSRGRDKATNGIDDDGNGYIDDVIGWDFVTNDNKPYDLKVSIWELLLKGGNPGHGTHCAGNVAARGFNGRGISGVAPNVSIMPIRFLSEKGMGTTADAVKAILYAVENGAHITSNSWGSEGEDSNDPSNEALREAIRHAQSRGSLFIAAAGNGRISGAAARGYDNDTDAKPSYPASYDMDIIVSVAALDSENRLGTFSNYGKRTVDLGAPGVAVYSTVVGNGYSDAVINFLGFRVTWDGTSMATPHVAGAAALYMSHRAGASWMDIKSALLQSTVDVPALRNKTVSGGKLNVDRLMNY